METRKILLSLAIKYNGNWEKIYKCILNKDVPTDSEINDLCLQYKGNYITLLDEEYPESLKQIQQPPFVLFYDGDITLLKDKNYKRLAITTTDQSFKKDLFAFDKVVDNENNDLVYVFFNRKMLAIDTLITNHNKGIMVVSGFNQNKEKIDGLVISDRLTSESDKASSLFTSRIVAGVCDKVLVLSGNSFASFITYTALSSGKDIMAVPTSIGPNDTFINNSLISQGAYCVYDKVSFMVVWK